MRIFSSLNISSNIVTVYFTYFRYVKWKETTLKKSQLLWKGAWNPCIFTCVAKGESRSRSAVTPSLCPSFCPSVRPKILSSQLIWNYWSNYHETWYVDRTSYVVMHISRKFWSPHFFGVMSLETLKILINDLVIAPPLKLLIHLSWYFVCR